MAIRIANDDRLPPRRFHHSGAHKRRPEFPEIQLGLCRPHPHEPGLPSTEIVHSLIRRIRASIAWRRILQEFYAWAGACPEIRNTQTRSKHVVEPLLLRTIVLAFSSNLKPENVAIEPQARICIRDHDRRVIYSQK